jgi:hypothetical protein
LIVDTAILIIVVSPHVARKKDPSPVRNVDRCGRPGGFRLTATKGFEYDQSHCEAPAMVGRRNGNDMSETAENQGWAG